MKPFVSVIIAIYNSEKWLRRCLRSAVSQTLKNIEILLIDDGSTDSSPIICDEFASQDPRIKVFHRQNSGVCATRQFGIDHALGDYLIYLDSDDFVDPTTYERMYQKAIKQDADIVVCDWYCLYGEKMFSDQLKVKKWDASHLLISLIQDQPTYQTIFLFKRELFQTLSVGFPKERISYGEDTILLVDLLYKGINQRGKLSLYHIPVPLYYYDRTINPGSLMKLSGKDMNIAQMNLWMGIGDSLSTEQTRKALHNRLVKCLFAAVWNQYYSQESFQEKYLRLLPDIKKFATFGLRKWFVCQALKGRLSFVERLKWLAAPIILQEKYEQFCFKRRETIAPKELIAL